MSEVWVITTELGDYDSVAEVRPPLHTSLESAKEHGERLYNEWRASMRETISQNAKHFDKEWKERQLAALEVPFEWRYDKGWFFQIRNEWYLWLNSYELAE